MKTSIKTLIAAVLTTVVLSAATPAVKAENNTQVTTLNNVKNVNKIVVSGNVELILVQDHKESVKVYDNYYAKNALIQQDDATLRISSFNKEKLTVVAHVNNLTSIEVTNTSSVVTKGKFNLLGLDVILKDNATADINAATMSLYTAVSDNAELKLTGNATNYVAVLGATAKVTMDQFAAEYNSIRSVSPVYNAKIALTKESIETFDAADYE